MKSETTHISPVTLNSKDYGNHKNFDITFVDCAGQLDNRTVEIDISNSYGVASAVKVCKSLRIVMLMSKLN